MKNLKISDFWIYKFRYQIGIGILSLSYLAIIIYTLLFAPNSLTAGEIESTKNAASLNFSNIFSKNIIDFPFRFLQKISIDIFGLSNFAIKLPSVLISLISLIFITKISGVWFSKRTSVLASIIAITSSQFFFIAQNGTSEILYIFYPILLIWSGSEFLKEPKKHQIFALISILGLSFYTPLSSYIALAFLLTILAHPHLRFTIKKTPKSQKIPAISLFITIILPLLISIVFDFSILKIIFGIPNSFNLFENLKSLILALFGFSNPISNGMISPIVNPATVILTAIGLYFIIIEKHSAKSYLINIWTVILLFVCLVNPATITILFTPILILTITGLQGLINTWYALFPKNPYARFFGLIPTSIFVFNLLITNLSVFALSYRYSPQPLSAFSQDLNILLEKTDSNRILIVSKNEEEFYKTLEKQGKAKIKYKLEDAEVIVSKETYENLKIPANYSVKKILVSNRKNNADRFYILSRG